LHVLPKGLVRIRHFGLFANRRRSAALERCRKLLGAVVLRLERNSDGGFHLTEIARLPARGDGLVSLGQDLFAVRSAGRTIVFSSKLGILGLAMCE
jgi:hypothetical protein